MKKLLFCIYNYNVDIYWNLLRITHNPSNKSYINKSTSHIKNLISNINNKI